MKIFIAIIFILIVIAVFLPIYSGREFCMGAMGGGCDTEKNNLIDYIKYTQSSKYKMSN